MGAKMQLSDRIGRRMKLHDLHVLMAVVQAGSMSKAAQLLNTTQPAVSRSIADLEHAIGVRLLDRRRHGVEPTAFGRAMLEGGTAMFDGLRQAVKNIEFLADPTAGEVRIGTTPPLAASFVSAVIDRMSRRYPRIVFKVVVGTSEVQQQNLSERSVDLLVSRRTRYFANDQVNFEALYESPYVVAAGERNPWVRRRRINLAELMGELWVLPSPDVSFGPFVAEAFRASGLEVPRTTVIASALEMCASLLKTNRYLTILPEFWLQLPDRHPFIRKLAVTLPVTGAPIGIISLKNRTPSPVVRRFIDCAREVAKPLVRRP
jgi:DNA-binding transcriptional LysR family regulator